MEEERKMSRAYMRSQQSSEGISLNECLHPQRYYLELDIEDPNGKRVCQVAMSYEQFVRLLLCNSSVPITLAGYRGTDGKWQEEKVPEPASVQDKVINRLGEVGESLINRVTDLRKDLYEVLNSGKVGKKKLEELLESCKTIESHFKSNYSYFVKCAAEEVSEIQENAKAQLSMFVNRAFGANTTGGDFTPLLEGKSTLALPDTSSVIVDKYEMKERSKKPIDDMTAMEVADELTRRLRQIEAAEDRYFEKSKESGKDESDKKRLFWANASDKGNKISLTYISYQGSHVIDLEKAKRYLKFLVSLKNLHEFKTDHWFEKDS